MGFYHWTADGLVLDLRLQPRASRCEFAGQHGERLKIRLTAPPADGKANRQLREFLGNSFSVAPSRVLILSGESGRNKRIKIERPASIPQCLREAGLHDPE
ncbi:MAG: DUF167 family protein [Gammaproteobacteria bacterium]|nr:DUF167 family protein [Gammaproteobacteria bacterium]MCZ6826453.1 DUF167 family protein [Gammaproteobacteria bacterium]